MSRDERGAVTAETAVVLPMIAVFAVGLAWLVSLGVVEVRAQDAAREAARVVARGESVAAGTAYARRVATPGADELPTGPALTAADRCDACGAQAYVRVTVNGSELLFCAHHAKKHHEKLSSIATNWHDETSRLFEDQRA